MTIGEKIGIGLMAWVCSGIILLWVLSIRSAWRHYVEITTYSEEDEK